MKRRRYCGVALFAGIAGLCCSVYDLRQANALHASALIYDPSATYTIQGVASGKCVQVAGSSTANSANAQIQPCSGAGAQQFQIG